MHVFGEEKSLIFQWQTVSHVWCWKHVFLVMRQEIHLHWFSYVVLQNILSPDIPVQLNPAWPGTPGQRWNMDSFQASILFQRVRSLEDLTVIHIVGQFDKKADLMAVVTDRPWANDRPQRDLQSFPEKHVEQKRETMADNWTLKRGPSLVNPYTCSTPESKNAHLRFCCDLVCLSVFVGIQNHVLDGRTYCDRKPPPGYVLFSCRFNEDISSLSVCCRPWGSARPLLLEHMPQYWSAVQCHVQV